MSIEISERLKAGLTDKYVVVKPDVPELRRFAAFTGVVKTVNMSGRALVQFDGPADIGWYDIDPQYLVVVDAPVKKVAEKHAAPAKDNDAKPGVAAKPASGKSPLEMARAQGAGQAAGAPAAPKAGPAAAPTGAPAATTVKKLSPLEMARQQGAMKAGAAGQAAAAPAPVASAAAAPAAAATASAAAPAAAVTPTQPAGKPLSPLELARMQGAAKAGATTAPPTAAVASPAVVAAPAPAPATASPQKNEPQPAAPAPAPIAAAPPAAKPSGAPAATGGKPLSPLELARQQGAFKGDKG